MSKKITVIGTETDEFTKDTIYRSLISLVEMYFQNHPNEYKEVINKTKENNNETH